MRKRLESILQAEDLTHFLDLFLSEDISDDILVDLTEKDLAKIGIAQLGVRKRLIQAFQKSGPNLNPLASEIIEIPILPAPVVSATSLQTTSDKISPITPQVGDTEVRQRAIFYGSQQRKNLVKTDVNKIVITNTSSNGLEKPLPETLNQSASASSNSAHGLCIGKLLRGFFETVFYIFILILACAIVALFIYILFIVARNAVNSFSNRPQSAHVNTEARVIERPSSPLTKPAATQIGKIENNNLHSDSQGNRSKTLAAQRKRVLSGHYEPLDIQITRSESGISVSFFGRQIVKALRCLSPKQATIYQVKFANCENEPTFPIFLERNNREFNIVCLDINELVRVLDDIINRHNTARASRAETFKIPVSTGAGLASGADFDSVMGAKFVFKWNNEFLNKSFDSYPVLERNMCFSTGNLGSPSDTFTLYDAMINRKALIILKNSCKK